MLGLALHCTPQSISNEAPAMVGIMGQGWPFHTFNSTISCPLLRLLLCRRNKVIGFPFFTSLMQQRLRNLLRRIAMTGDSLFVIFSSALIITIRSLSYSYRQVHFEWPLLFLLKLLDIPSVLPVQHLYYFLGSAIASHSQRQW